MVICALCFGRLRGRWCMPLWIPLFTRVYGGLHHVDLKWFMIVILKAVLLELHPLMARSNQALIAQVELGFDWPLS